MAKRKHSLKGSCVVLVPKKLVWSAGELPGEQVATGPCGVFKLYSPGNLPGKHNDKAFLEKVSKYWHLRGPDNAGFMRDTEEEAKLAAEQYNQHIGVKLLEAHYEEA